jgi:hypothetical protein
MVEQKVYYNVVNEMDGSMGLTLQVILLRIHNRHFDWYDISL